MPTSKRKWKNNNKGNNASRNNKKGTNGNWKTNNKGNKIYYNKGEPTKKVYKNDPLKTEYGICPITLNFPPMGQGIVITKGKNAKGNDILETYDINALKKALNQTMRTQQKRLIPTTRQPISNINLKKLYPQGVPSNRPSLTNRRISPRTVALAPRNFTGRGVRAFIDALNNRNFNALVNSASRDMNGSGSFTYRYIWELANPTTDPDHQNTLVTPNAFPVARNEYRNHGSRMETMNNNDLSTDNIRALSQNELDQFRDYLSVLLSIPRYWLGPHIVRSTAGVRAELRSRNRASYDTWARHYARKWNRWNRTVAIGLLNP